MQSAVIRQARRDFPGPGPGPSASTRLSVAKGC